MKKLLSIFLLISVCAKAQFGPSTNSYFDVATEAPSSSFLILNTPGVGNYNLSATNALELLNASAVNPIGGATAQSVTNTVIALTPSIMATNLIPVSTLISYVGGQSKATGAYANGAFATNGQYLLISPAGSSGVIKSLFVMGDVGVTGGLNTNLSKVKLNVYTDSNLTFSVFLSDLSGVRYLNPTNRWLVDRQSYWLDTLSDSDLELAPGQYLYTYSIKLPMPFTNGAYAVLTNTAAGTPWTHGYISAQYNVGVPPGFDQVRLYSYSTNYNPLPASTSNVLFTVSGSGQVLGVMLALSNRLADDVLGFQDSHGMLFKLNGYDWQMTGLDDFIGRTWGGASGTSGGRNGLGEVYGCTDYQYALSAPGWMESYRWITDGMMSFTNGLSVLTTGAVGLDNASFTVFYLRKP